MLREKDKRNFRRYKNASECEIRYSTVTCKGKVLDYSDGIGIVLESSPDLIQGTAVDIHVYDHDLKFKGEIAWVRKAGKYLRAGIRRADKFSGDLKDFILPDILFGLYTSAKTGILEITNGSTVKKVLFEKGDMIYAASNDEDDRLGDYLLKMGKLTLTEYEAASDILTKTWQRFGKILVKFAYMNPKKITPEIRNHIEKIIINLFKTTEGTFKFNDGLVFPPEEMITLRMSTANIIYRGIKRCESLKTIKRMCPALEDILNCTQNPLLKFQSLGLEDTDGKILCLINGLYPLKTILSLSPSSNYETLKTISAFLSIGLIYVKGESDLPAEFAVDEVFEEQEETPPDFLEKAEEIFRKCGNSGYYEFLGVASDAPDEKIKKAYFHLSKQFHPDRHFPYNSPNIKDNLLKITSYATEAYEVLSNPKKRREYNKILLIINEEKATESEETVFSGDESLVIENQEAPGM